MVGGTARCPPIPIIGTDRLYRPSANISVIEVDRQCCGGALATSRSLSRHCHTTGFETQRQPQLLIDQGFNDDGHDPSTLHRERVGSTRREVDDSFANVWAAVVDFDDDRAAVVEVRHLRVRGQRERAVRGGGGDGVEDLAAGGLTAYVVVPRSFPKLTNLSHAHRAATEVRDTVAGIC